MMNWKTAVLAAATIALACNAVAQEDPRRFKLIPFAEMTPDQRKYADAVMAGPTSSTGSAAVVPGASTIGSPFNVYLRSPLLADQLRRVGEYIRFKTTLPAKLNEFAILVTARQWGAQYEWFAHHRLALKAGLNPAIAEDLAQGRRPAGMSDDEAAIYTFSQELHTTHAVSDATYKAVADKFGEQGVMDLIAVNGYYVLVSMVLNVDRTPLPGGAKPPLPQLK
ncbi:MAG: carboxymuconolactone decarboxylase family protein [Proteobacteria bacterium]|nr:carboxymuconolactone decarboxylase family protein [Pseudomonadota bacterium]